MIGDLLVSIFNADFLYSVIRITAPILFAALGAVIAEKAGVVNIGLEGIMMISALFGVLFGYWTQSWLVGVLGAVLVGVLLALMIGFFAFRMKTDIILGGNRGKHVRRGRNHLPAQHVHRNERKHRLTGHAGTAYSDCQYPFD